MYVDLTCQTFAPIVARLCAAWPRCRRLQPMGCEQASEVRPPAWDRLKCKPVSGAVGKQSESLVPLVPYRTGAFSWTRLWTAATLDAEQDPRRRRKHDTVFYIYGLNAMGESAVVLCCLFFYLFFILSFLLSGMQRGAAAQSGRKGARHGVTGM